MIKTCSPPGNQKVDLGTNIEGNILNKNLKNSFHLSSYPFILLDLAFHQVH